MSTEAAEARDRLAQDPDSGYDNLGQSEEDDAEMEGELAKIWEAETGPGGPAPPALEAEGGDNVQATSLNGAQVSSMVSIVSQVATGQLPRGSGINILLAAFPISSEVAEKIMGEAGQGFVPAGQEQPASSLGQDAWNEEDHPRDEDGQFGSGSRGGAAKTTSPEEKQKKIDSVKINFDRDNTLPGLNAEDLEKLGKEDKPVVLKKSVIERNSDRHPDIRQEEYNYLISHALYDPDSIKPSKNKDKPNYYNFVKHLEDTNSVVLIELSSGKDSHEIVHLVKMNDKNAGKL